MRRFWCCWCCWCCSTILLRSGRVLTAVLCHSKQEIRWSKDDTLSADALHSWMSVQPAPSISTARSKMMDTAVAAPASRAQHVCCRCSKSDVPSFAVSAVRLCVCVRSLKQTMPSQVVKLTYENFDSTVMQSDDTWIVDLSAGPRCGAQDHSGHYTHR